MAPRIDEWAGFEVRINTRDHEPPHVHVCKDDANLRVFLDRDSSAEYCYGRMKASDERAAVRLVNKRRSRYLQRWREINPE
jgi:hypothetical protein